MELNIVLQSTSSAIISYWPQWAQALAERRDKRSVHLNKQMLDVGTLHLFRQKKKKKKTMNIHNVFNLLFGSQRKSSIFLVILTKYMNTNISFMKQTHNWKTFFSFWVGKVRPMSLKQENRSQIRIYTKIIKGRQMV